VSKETGEAEGAERILTLAGKAAPHLTGPEDATWMDRLESEHDALRSAFTWFLDNAKGAKALELAADLWMFQEERGHADDARDWLAKALSAPGAEARTVTRARALYGAGILAFRKLDEDAAVRSFEECLSIARERDDVPSIVKANTGLARVALRREDTREVRKRSEEALAIARQRGEKADAVSPLHMLAAAARVDGDIGQARQFYQENLALNRELGRVDVISVELQNLGALEVLEGNISEAVPFLRESLGMAHRRGDRYLAPYGLVWLGRVAFAEGDPVRAATLFAAARTQFDATGLAMDPDEAPEYEKGLAAIRGALDASAFAAAWAIGEKMTLNTAVAFALRPELP
jgi:tetratricopeptide (TPR) repeat protein